MTSIEYHRPMLVSEEDCTVAMPSTRTTADLSPSLVSAANEPCPWLAVMIPLGRLLGQLRKALRATTLSSDTLDVFGQSLEAHQSRAADLQPSRAEGFVLLLPTVAALGARLQLYRHNLTVACSPEERAEALRRCCCIAKETVAIAPRLLNAETALLHRCASNALCLHLWRCTLVLSFCAEYHGALTCVALAARLGAARHINLACSAHLLFFLGRLGAAPPSADEELLAYVSADMQGTERAWVWSGSPSSAVAPDTQAEAFTPRAGDDDARTPNAGARDADSVHATQLVLRPASSRDRDDYDAWDHWDQLRRLLVQLRQDGRPTPNARHGPLHPYAAPAPAVPPPPGARDTGPPSSASSYYAPAHNPVKRVQLCANAAGATSAPGQRPAVAVPGAAAVASPAPAAGNARSGGRGRTKISIESII